jgi:hypothetical protein
MLRDPEAANPKIKKGRAGVSYKNIFTDVLTPHRVNLKGWPAGMDLVSPSSMQMDQLRTLYDLIRKEPPELKFVPLTEEEFAELSAAREEALKTGIGMLPTYQSNPRKNSSSSSTSKKSRKRSSEEIIDSSDEADADKENKKPYLDIDVPAGTNAVPGHPPSKALTSEVTSKLKNITSFVNNEIALSRDDVQSLPIQQGLADSERNAGLEMFAPVHAAHVAADLPHASSDMTVTYPLYSDGANAPHELASNLGSAPVYDFGTVQEAVSFDFSGIDFNSVTNSATATNALESLWKNMNTGGFDYSEYIEGFDGEPGHVQGSWASF